MKHSPDEKFCFQGLEKLRLSSDSEMQDSYPDCSRKPAEATRRSRIPVG